MRRGVLGPHGPPQCDFNPKRLLTLLCTSASDRDDGICVSHPKSPNAGEDLAQSQTRLMHNPSSCQKDHGQGERNYSRGSGDRESMHGK